MFNVIDLAVAVALLYFAWRGYENGLFSGILHLISTVISTVGAMYFYAPLAGLIHTQFTVGTHVSNIIGFFVLLIILECITSFLFGMVYRMFIIKLLTYGWVYKVDQVLGTIPSVGTGLIFILVFLLLPIALPYDIGFKEHIEKSWSGKVLLPQAYVFEPALQKVLKHLPTQSLLFAITPTPTSRETSYLEFPANLQLKPNESDEAKMLELLNNERVSRGISPLTWDPEIVPVARAHSEDMFRRGYFSHYNPEGESAFERMDKAGIKFLAAGENLAYAPSVEIAHQGLMNSPGHKENILRKEFGRIGIGVIDGGINGKMFTQDFAD